MHNGQSNSHEETSIGGAHDNETLWVRLRPRRNRLSIGADGEIETLRGNGTEENSENGNFVLDVSFEEVPEMESEKKKDSFRNPSDLDNNDNSLFGCVRENHNTTVPCRPGNESNNDRDCIGAQNHLSPIELPRTGDDNRKGKTEKRISIQSVDANREIDNDSSLEPNIVLRNLKQDSSVDDSITIIDNAVLTRRQSKDIELWIKGENVDSDSNSEDSEISFKCSPAKQPESSFNSSPIKQPENSVKALNFSCDCGHNFARRSSLTLHRKGSKCPINEGKLNAAASTSLSEIQPDEKVVHNIEPKQGDNSVKCGIQSTKRMMSKYRRSSLPLVRRGTKISRNVEGRAGPLMEVLPSQGRALRGRRSVGVCETKQRSDTSSTELDAQMSIADLLESLAPKGDITTKKKTKKRTRSSSDVENYVNINKKTRLSSPKLDEDSKRDEEEDTKSEALVNAKNGKSKVSLTQDLQRGTEKKFETKRRSRSTADTPQGIGVSVEGAVSDPALLKDTRREDNKNDNVSLPAKRGRGRPKKIKDSNMKSTNFESGPMQSEGDNIPSVPKTIAQEMMEAIQANILESVLEDVKPNDRDVDVQVPCLNSTPAPKRNRGRPPKVKVTSNADRFCVEEKEVTPRKESTGSENSLVSPRSSSSSSQPNRTKSKKLVKVKRRTEEFVKKSIARAKANLYNTKEGKAKMFACICGGLYTQKQSVLRHQQNSNCPVQSFSDIKHVFVEKVEKPMRERKFVCSCGRAFTQSSSMQRHQKNSTCPFISAAVFNTNTAPRKRGRRKKSTPQSTDAENTQANPESTVSCGDVSKGAKSMNGSETIGDDNQSNGIASTNDIQSVNKDGNNSTESDEEFVTGKRVDYSLKASYICSCNQTFKFHGSIRRHQKHSKCVGMRKVVRGTRKDARKNSAASVETDKNTKKLDIAQCTKKKSPLSQENKNIKEDPDGPAKSIDAHSSGSVLSTKSSKVERKRRTSNVDEGIVNKKGTSSTVHETADQSPKLNSRKVTMKKQKPMKRLQRQVNVPGYYFPCQCGRKYRHKRDLCTHQKRSTTCPRNSRYTMPVYYSLSQLQRTHALNRAKQGMYIAMEQKRKTNESETTKTAAATIATTGKIIENSSPRKRTPRAKQIEVMKHEVSGVESTDTSPEKEYKQRESTEMDYDGNIKNVSFENGKDASLDVRTYIRCKCGSSFTRMPSLNRHWKHSCTTVSDKDKQRIVAEIRKVIPLRSRGRERKDKVVSTKIHSKARNLVIKAKNMAVQNASKKMTKLTRRMPARKTRRIEKRKLRPGFSNLSDPPGRYPCPCGKTYKYRRDLQGHQRRSEKCPKTAWINKAKIEEYGQAPEHVKESLALISKWKAERDSSTGGELPRKDSNPIVTIAEKESPKPHRYVKSKNKRKRHSHEIVKNIDSETKRAEKTVKLENIVEELTARRDKPNQSRRTREKRESCNEEMTGLYTCACGKSYTHRENLRKHLGRSLCDTTSYVRKLLDIKNNKIYVKSEVPVESEATPRPIKLEPFEDAVFAIGLDLVNKECGKAQENREEVAMIYRTKGGMRKPLKRLVNLNKKFLCKCGKEFKHRSSLYNHRRMTAKCRRNTLPAAETLAASQTSPAAKS